MPAAGSRQRAENLNRDCRCIGVDRARFLDALHRGARLSPGTLLLAESHAQLVANTPIFLGAEDAAAIRAGVAALHQLSRLPPYLRRAEAIGGQPLARDFGPLGGILGLDFHLSPQGPKLIEINTNAGGALINCAVAEALLNCCEPAQEGFAALQEAARTIRREILEVFRSEWRRQRGDGDPATVAIVDEAPESQYLYPEFLLFQTLFEDAGWRAHITDPARLRFADGRLMLDGTVIDLVYNRLTDFALAQPASAALRAAYAAGAAVVTPHPRAHALLADKRLLALLGDAAELKTLGLPSAEAQALAALVPATCAVDGTRSEHLYAQRKHYYFKPAGGYGSKAAYDGAKLTRKVWQDIVAGRYVAQERVPPSERQISLDGEVAALKFDLRAYAYSGRVLFMAARLYRGQTTNFRTPGGGFAPVIELPPRPAADPAPRP